MKKTKAELKSMANEIAAQYGCFLNVTEVGKVLGISRETARMITNKEIPLECLCRRHI